MVAHPAAEQAASYTARKGHGLQLQAAPLDAQPPALLAVAPHVQFAASAAVELAARLAAQHAAKSAAHRKCTSGCMVCCIPTNIAALTEQKQTLHGWYKNA